MNILRQSVSACQIVALLAVQAVAQKPSGHRLIAQDKGHVAIVNETPLTVDNPSSHRDTRRVRKLDNGNYLACHEGDGMVREYDRSGKVVWSYKLDLNGQPRTPNHDGHGVEVFNAVRLPNGNT